VYAYAPGSAKPGFLIAMPEDEPRVEVDSFKVEIELLWL
jgi:hypothetical protein